MRGWILLLLLVLGCSTQTLPPLVESIITPSPTWSTPSPNIEPTRQPTLTPTSSPSYVPYPIRLTWRGAVYPEHIQASSKSIELWNQELGEDVFSFSPGPGQPADVEMMNQEEGLIHGGGRSSVAIGLAWASGDTWRIKVYIGLSEPQLTSVFLHEYGHLLFLSHSPQVEDIMYRSVPPQITKKLSKNDIQRALVTVLDTKARHGLK